MSAAIWGALGAVVVALVTGGVAYLVAIINRRPTQHSVDVVGLAAAADEWRELKDDYRGRLLKAEERIDRVVADLNAMSSRLHEVEDDRDALAEAAADLAHWEDSGRPDPPGAPQLPPRIRVILARLHDPR